MDIQELSDKVRDTLKWWLDIHHDPTKWAENWTIGYDYLRALRTFPELENDYFSYSFADDAFTVWAEDNVNLFSKCSECGYIFESGYDHDNDCIDADTEDVKTGDLADYMQDCYDLESLPLTEDQARRLWEGPAFTAYYDAVEPIFRQNAEEIKETLTALDRANDDDALIAALETAIEVQHVHGSVVVDYGSQCGIEYDDAERMVEDGIQEFLSEEI